MLKVNSEYRRALKKLDTKFHNTGEGELGPLVQKLTSFAFGILGEISQDFHLLVKEISDARCSYLGKQRGWDILDNEAGQIFHGIRRLQSRSIIFAKNITQYMHNHCNYVPFIS